MSINTYSVIESMSSIVMFVEVDEQLRNGDIVVVSLCHFYAADGTDIGYARLIEDGYHRQVSGDYTGRKLLDKFQYIGV